MRPGKAMQSPQAKASALRATPFAQIMIDR
jgi:hypothetical protein